MTAVQLGLCSLPLQHIKLLLPFTRSGPALCRVSGGLSPELPVLDT